MPVQEHERDLLKRLTDPNENRQKVRFDLFGFYCCLGLVAEALAVATDYLAETQNADEIAEVYFILGLAMERIEDWESAIRWYREALELHPGCKLTWYMLHNNTGYSLNQQERYADAEEYLRKAIVIDPMRANAFKNLGLSQEGQGLYVDAVESFVAAVRANAADPRALGHLQDLVDGHAELFIVISDLEDKIDMCREAVELAARRDGGREWPGSPRRS
jgi:tetratricopeptide (TPR) repeat protein